jgi:membrane-bound ClpP family serine protease
MQLLATATDNNLLVWTYGIYLTLSLVLTVWVARTLHHHGRVFLVTAFHGDESLADSVNHLLVVGFYLINLGWVTLALKTGETPLTTGDVFELLSYKLGVVLLILGAMHFFNIYVFNRMRKNAQYDQAPPPIEPDEQLDLEPAG